MTPLLLRRWLANVVGRGTAPARRQGRPRPQLEALEQRTLLSFVPAPGSPFAVGEAPVGVVSRDFNGDGRLDLAVGTLGSAVSVLLGRGDGTFGPQAAFAAGNAPSAVRAGDFNHDGALDLAVANFDDATLGILAGNGNGTFQGQQTFPVGQEPQSLAVGDFNGPPGQEDDVVVANKSNESNDVNVFVNVGTSLIARPTLAAGQGPSAIALGHLNGDPFLDIAVANMFDSSVSVMYGAGDGVFSSQQVLSTQPAQQPTGVAIGQLDHTGPPRPFVVTADSSSNSVSVFTHLEFSSPATYRFATGSQPTSVVARDLNGDQKDDIVVVNSGSNSVGILLGNGDGTFQPQQAFSVGNQPFEVVVADFSGDGRLDLAVTNFRDSTVSVLLQQASGFGRRQLVVGTEAGAGPVVRVLDATTGEERRSFLAFAPEFHGGVRVAVGDINGDGVGDTVAAAGPGGGPHVKVFSGRDHALLHSFFAYDPLFTGGVAVAAGDVTGDGMADIITGAGLGGGAHVKVFGGGALGGQVVQSFLAYDAEFRGGVTVAAGDITGDGVADILTGAGPGGGAHVKVFGGGALGGQVVQSFLAYDAVFRGGVTVAAGDINGDRVADIITGAGPGGGAHVKVFGGGALAGQVLHSFLAYDPLFLGGVRVGALDANGDGRSDILTGPGPGGGAHVKVHDGQTLGALASFLAFEPRYQVGIHIGG